MKHAEWTQDEHDTLLRLKKQGLTNNEMAIELTRMYNMTFTYDGVRNRLRDRKASKPKKGLLK